MNSMFTGFTGFIEFIGLIGFIGFRVIGTQKLGISLQNQQRLCPDAGCRAYGHPGPRLQDGKRITLKLAKPEKS